MRTASRWATTHSGTFEKMIGYFGTAPAAALESKPLDANSFACS